MSTQTFTREQAETRLAEMGFTALPETAEWTNGDVTGRISRTVNDRDEWTAVYLRLRDADGRMYDMLPVLVDNGCADCGHDVDDHNGTGPCPLDDCQSFCTAEEI